MLLVAAAMMLQVPAGCISPDAPWNEEDKGPPLQKSGAGLWIGGLPFGDAEILTVSAAPDPLTNEWSLEITFTEAGTKSFTEAQRCGVNRPFEVSVDRVVISRPMLREHIVGPKARLSGGFTRDSAADLAQRITARQRQGSIEP